MPDLDTGHIFLTTLAPIKAGGPEGEAASYRQRLRERLVELPTAQQSPATVKSGLQSPFARNRRTHLARMFVLDDVIYNGRDGHDAIVSSIKGLTGDAAAANPALPQPIDSLTCAYLVFCAEIDAVEHEGDPLPTDLSEQAQRRVRRAYAEELWHTMGEELAEIYANCEGFDGVDSASSFADYLDRCHVETTMPFHDYYLELPAFPKLRIGLLAAAVGAPLLVTLLALVLALFGVQQMPLVGGLPLWTALVGGVVTALAFFVAVRVAIANGERPLAPSPYDDLPSVLKALYVQQRFAELSIDLQGAPPEEIHARFGDWLAQHSPSDRNGPTQAPGVVDTPGA
jgi:hypothetical protein